MEIVFSSISEVLNIPLLRPIHSSKGKVKNSIISKPITETGISSKNLLKFIPSSLLRKRSNIERINKLIILNINYLKHS